MFEDFTSSAIPIVAVLLIALSKAGFAGGSGLIATPLLSLVIAPKAAVATLLPVLCACDWFSLYCYRKTFAWKPLLLSLPGAVAGIVLGALLMNQADEKQLKAFVGGIALFFVAYRLLQLAFRKKTSAWRPGPWTGNGFGAAAGFFSTLAHAAGPIMAAFLLPQNLGRRFYVGTTVVFFTVVNHLKLIPYGAMGMLEVDNLKHSLYLLPMVPLGVWTGVWLNKRISEKAFTGVIYTVLFLTGLKLVGLWELLQGLWTGA